MNHYCWGFSPDGRLFATTPFGSQAVISLWDAGTGKESVRLSVGTSTLFHLCFSQDGRRCAAAGADGSVQVWDTLSGAEIAHLSVHTSPPNFLALNSDGTRLASGANATVKVWDVKSGALLFAPRRQCDGVAFAPGGRTLAMAVSPHGTKVWDAETEGDWCLLPDCDATMPRYTVFPEGHRAVTTEIHRRRVIVWDWVSGARLATYGGGNIRGCYPSLSPDGTKLLAPYATNDGPSKQWLALRVRSYWLNKFVPTRYGLALIDLPSGRVLARLPECRTSAFLPDGHTIATLCDEHGPLQPSLKLWDLPPRSTFHVFPLGWLAPTAVLLTGLWWHMGRRKKTAAAVSPEGAHAIPVP